MKWNKKLASAILSIIMVLSVFLPSASAAELPATYSQASYYSIATTAYSRMLLFYDGVVPAANESRQYGLIDVTGKVVVDFQYDRLESTGGGYFIATKGNQMGIIDTSGTAVRPLTNCTIQMRNQIIAIADENWNYTYLTADLQPSSENAYYGSTGTSVSLPGYNWVDQTEDGYYLAYGENGTALLDPNQQVVVPAGTYDSIYTRCVTDGKTYYQASKGTQTCILDNTGKVVVPLGEYSYLGGVNASGLVSASVTTRNADGTVSGYSSKLYDLSGQEVSSWTDREVTTETYFRDLAFTLDGENYGTMDQNGNVLVPNQFSVLTTAGDTSKVVVGMDDPASDWSYLYGLYSADGAEIAAPIYQEFRILGDDYFRVYDGAHYGILNGSGSFTVPLEYKELRVYTRDFIEAVNDQDGSKMITADGREVIPQSLENIYVYDDQYTYSYHEYDYNTLTVSEDGYEGQVLPFRVKTSSGYETYYVDSKTGESLGSLPVVASNITSDGMFVYRDTTSGLYGFGQLTAGSFGNSYAPDSGKGSAVPTPGDPNGSETPAQVAYATSYSILVDGEEVAFDAYALRDADGNDTNYLKLRDVAHVLNGSLAQFNVGWDAEAGAITIQTRTDYTTPNGSEMSTPFTGDQAYTTNQAVVLVDGVETALEAITLTDSSGNGYTYFKVRDLGQALGFDVTWDSAAGAIVIDTTRPYSGT